MNKKLLKQQVDDFFSKNRSNQTSAWRQYKNQIKSEIKQKKHPSNLIENLKAKTPTLTPSPPLIKTKEYFDNLFKINQIKDDTSLESLSEISKKEENPTISLHPPSLPEILPIQSIHLVRDLLKSSTPDPSYLSELNLLSIDIQRLQNTANFS